MVTNAALDDDIAAFDEFRKEPTKTDVSCSECGHTLKEILFEKIPKSCPICDHEFTVEEAF